MAPRPLRCAALLATVAHSRWGPAPVVAEDCFESGEEIAYCCSRGEQCFESSHRYGGKGHSQCCGAEAIERVLYMPRMLMARATATRQELLHVAESARTVLLALDAENLEAWELLTQAVGRCAIDRFDALTPTGEQAFFDDMAENGSYKAGGEVEAISVARDLSYAAHLAERFFQVLWYSTAERTGLAPLEVDLKSLRPAFSDTFQVYRVIHAGLDALTYTPLGRNDPPLAPRSLRAGAEVVCMVVTVVGAWADVGMTTFWSILRRTSSPLRVFVFGDPLGLDDWRRAVADVERGLHDGAFAEVAFQYVDVFGHPRMNAYLRRLPKGCAGSKMAVALFARLVCHELLPDDVTRVIALDLGDVLVLGDILGLWREGDRLASGQLLAAASHRSKEEAARQGKPSMLNGGVVLYEVSRMRAANYTEDTIRAARLGLERRYPRFCSWDQDIINVMHEDLWGRSRVRVLPCRWSLFPVTGWQFSWNTPNHWLPEVFRLRRYPGLLSASHVEHFCPDELQLLPNVMAFQSPWHKQVARDMALLDGARHRAPGAAQRAPDGTLCACGERAALLHVPSTMKLWPWAQRLFEFHRPRSLRAPAAAFFTAREEQGEAEVGGGFWGAEDEADIAAARHAALLMAKEQGVTMRAGGCVTLPTGHGDYVRVDFADSRLAARRALELVVETSAKSDAQVFLGRMGVPPPGSDVGGGLLDIGMEIVVGGFRDTRSMMRWGVQGVELSSYAGSALAGGRWATFWIRLAADGKASVGLGRSVGESPIMGAVVSTPAGFDFLGASVYVGSPSAAAQFLVCRSGV